MSNSNNSAIIILLGICILIACVALVYGVIQLAVWALGMMLFHPAEVLAIIVSAFAISYFINKLRK